MIKEEYVSFETAKLLKEKGFDEEGCTSWYSTNGRLFHDIDSYEMDLDGTIKLCSAPTQQVAMRWLREEKHLAVQSIITTSLNKKLKWFSPISMFEEGHFKDIHSTDCYATYEEACEAGIRYCLDHLIKEL